MSVTNKITVKRAEIAVAVILALCSIALMIKSAENRITWNAEENMGAGFLPFYLSLGMLICTVLTIIKFVLKRSPQSKDDSPFIEAEAFKYIAVTIISLVILVLAIGIAIFKYTTTKIPAVRYKWHYRVLKMPVLGTCPIAIKIPSQSTSFNFPDTVSLILTPVTPVSFEP